MKKIVLLLMLLAAANALVTPQGSRPLVYVIDVSGDIDLGLPAYIGRVINEADREGADAVILRVNTFGGRVDAATQIKDAVMNADVPTAAFIDRRAISAGALISIACEKIFMVPGATIGAVTPVTQEGEKTPEKIVSYMRSEMRSTAQSRGRDPRIAEAMVDEEIEIPNIIEAGKLITFTTGEAIEHGYCDGEVGSLRDVLAAMGLEEAELREPRTNWAEQFVRFLSNPIMSSLLIMVGMLGLFMEVRSPGWGVPGTMAVIALTLFFGTQYILALANIIDIVLFVAGVGLLLVEAFVIPGFGVAGILGILLMFGGIFMALAGQWPLVTTTDIYRSIYTLAGAVVMTVIGGIAVTYLLPKTRAFGIFVLEEEQRRELGYSSHASHEGLVGKTGSALTSLRPSGTALIDDERVDVVSDGGYIDANRPVRVVRVEGIRVIVKEIRESP
jgi:membrane-bound serine protease (ClpP class)